MRFAIRWGEVWKGVDDMAPPAPAKMSKSMENAPTLHLDTNNNRWVRTWSPAPHYRPAADMKPKEFAQHWQTASKETLHPDELEHVHSDAFAHESQRKKTFAAALHPGKVDGQFEAHGPGHPHRDITPALLGAFPKSRHATRPTGLVLVRGGSKPAGSTESLQRAHRESTAQNALRHVSDESFFRQVIAEMEAAGAPEAGHGPAHKSQLELALEESGATRKNDPEIRASDKPRVPGVCNSCKGNIPKQDKEATESKCGACLRTIQMSFDKNPTSHCVVK